MAFIGLCGGQDHDVSVPKRDIMMGAHTSGTGLVDSIRVLTQLVESHTPFT